MYHQQTRQGKFFSLDSFFFFFFFITFFLFSRHLHMAHAVIYWLGDEMALPLIRLADQSEIKWKEA